MNVRLGWLGIGLAALALVSSASAQAKPLTLQHTPVTVAIRGQPLIVRAQVAAGSRAIKSVTLFYSTSRDAAPFGVAMQPAAGGMYIGSVPDNVLAGLEQLSYYIAAEDAVGATTETAWFTVRVKTAQPGQTGPERGGAVSGAESGQRPGWVTPALVAGGVLLVGGAVAIAAGSGGGGGGDDGGDGGGGGTNTTTNTTSYVGKYVGSATACEEVTGSAPACTSHGVQIKISTGGTVSSSDLHPNATMESSLSGVNFVLIGPVVNNGRSGEIRYIGTVVDGRIVGSIEGSATAPTGTVHYTGTFNAIKQ